ncbi:phenylalanine--tRNA ligase subunit beta [Corynebacterium sp. ES2794-CONJ1]|uniref:phenylalanine--tRNA ligase subunit beta n=1 Tax=unclassified Corynebacterium TaxID=2624378 RepID=UPI00216AC1AD|nr:MULTISPECIES: phenylalanine--tRNA ligase subunit beta [unclassified Corynebacterium]MCS4532658.1 phenylalanine--tRNA ligase subunit beta [Corynebacterium sp. ES2730-CONJ]MCU9520053.1 phenylalanine--tRNA ligase subunit beta [Corynebacterium sp. ES2794-CONJ1]
MLISQNWLSALLKRSNPQWPGVSAEELDAAFVRVGFETEGYRELPKISGPLVIGRVADIEELEGFKKPIRHCHVDVGQSNGTGDLQSIVCGARNFSVGSTVVVSLPGAVLPGNFAIATRETYGRISAGMICSAAELGLTEKSEGIIVLSDYEGELGADARSVLGLDDTVFDVNITPDRGYALSVRGLVRELAAAFGLHYDDPALEEISGVPTASESLIQIHIAEDTRAQRFGIRHVSGCDPEAITPLWMQRELLLSGQRLINLPTDITNYVMLYLGQPMHAFDAHKIEGDLRIRRAAAGEKLELIDHQVKALDLEDVVIADDSHVLSLAGVMGGSHSEISESTTDIYLEAAHWDPISIARTSRRHKISSESSRRFERGVDPALVEVALDLAADLLARYGGGSIEPNSTIVGEIPDMPEILMRASRPSELVGVDYGLDTVVARLKEVGCQVTVDPAAENLTVKPATWRPDLEEPCDLVEEILRLEGLEAIPSIVPQAPVGHGLSPAQKRRRAVGHALAYNGYVEILPTPFIKNDTFDTWGLSADDPRRAVVSVQNPLDADYAIIGTTLLPSMLEALSRNIARGTNDIALFGQQQVAFAHGGGRSPMLDVRTRPSARDIEAVMNSLPYQPVHIAAVGSGLIAVDGPLSQARTYSYADAIEAARIVARAAGVTLTVRNADELPWHPGRCAALLVDDTVVGYAGELHPQIVEKLGLPHRTCAMEMDMTALPIRETLPAPVLSAYPTLKQDLALVVDEDVPSEHVRAAIVEAAGPLLESAELFDIYRAETLGDHKKSLTFALTFRAQDRTLTDDECSEGRLAAVKRAGDLFGATMRS